MRVFLFLLAACRTSQPPTELPDTDLTPTRPASEVDAPVSEPARDAPNILVIIADDLGVDATSTYPYHPSAPHTPALEALAAEGTTFDQFWATPACTTTRAALITGQHGFTSGVTHVPAALPPGIPTLPSTLRDHGYHTAAFGKWHLGGGRPPADHPHAFGIDHFAGNLANIGDYRAWDLTINGQASPETAYHTTKITDLAIEHLRAVPEGKPWFAWMAYAAPHAPFHQPPADLAPVHGSRPAQQYQAMVEAMDHEIARLLEAVPPNTYVLFLGDNGTPPRARHADLYARDHAKGSVYEGGIRTPFIVSGPGIRKGERTDALANATDVFATVLGLAGVDVTPPSHSVDLTPALRQESGSPRDLNYSEYTQDGALSWTVRDADLKVIVHADGRIERFATRDFGEVSPLADSPEARVLLEAGATLRANVNAPAGSAELSACTEVARSGSHTARGPSGALVGNVSIRVDGNHCVVEANGIPDHAFGDPKRPFPHDVAAVAHAYRFPTAPRRMPNPTPLTLDADDGVMLNGVPIDVLAAACFGVGDGKIGCNDPTTPWRFDPVHPANTFRMDAQFAHTQPDGGYHYHGPPNVPARPAIVGFAADGFPIRSPWIREGNTVRELRPSYRLKTGNRQPQPGAAAHPGGSYDGTFRDDWTYEAGHGDLDACNGMAFPSGYAYVATTGFPYFPACFTGQPDPSFAKRGPANGSRSKAKGGKAKGTKAKAKLRR